MSFIGSIRTDYYEYSMRTPTVEHQSFTARLECRYLLHIPEQLDDKSLLIITLHGYSSNPEVMLRLTGGLMGDRHVIAALEAPNQHYVTDGLPNRQSVPGYNWGISPHWESAVRLHHEMVLQTLGSLRDRFQMGRERCLLVGFSQPVGLNYRFAGTHPGEVAGIIGLCGGVPRDWEEDKYRSVEAAVLHISRDQDEFYPVEMVTQFPEGLRRHAADVEFHLLEGPHRFPSKANGIVRAWMDRVFGHG
jgi:predicted esterase